MEYENLYNIAVECARLNSNGCTLACGQCQYNVFHYLDDFREASLIKANAYAEFSRAIDLELYNIKEAHKEKNKKIVITIGIILFCLFCIGKCNARINESNQPKSVVQSVQTAPQAEPAKVVEQPKPPAPKPKTELQIIKENQNKPENITRVLAYMRKNGVKDRNADGQVNCIDHSVTFRELYGSKADLIINNNPKQNFNHMFIRVSTNSGYVFVEPQGTPDLYAMNLFWGMKYNSAFNEIATSGWGGWVGS